MEKRTNWIMGILTVLITFMDITGIPCSFFLNIQIKDVEPIYWTLMANFILIGIIAWAVLRFFCPDLRLGLQKNGFCCGFRKYGLWGTLAAVTGFFAFYIGLSPLDAHPSLMKVLIEGVIYYIGVAMVEELYVRGLLLNLLERWLKKHSSPTLWAVILSSLIFGLGHIPMTLGMPIPVTIAKALWTVGMGMYLGMIYKKSGNLWVPIVIHFLINVCAIPYCFSTFRGYPNITLIIEVAVYTALGVYSLIQLLPGAHEKHHASC